MVLTEGILQNIPPPSLRGWCAEKNPALNTDKQRAVGIVHPSVHPSTHPSINQSKATAIGGQGVCGFYHLTTHSLSLRCLDKISQYPASCTLLAAIV